MLSRSSRPILGIPTRPAAEFSRLLPSQSRSLCLRAYARPSPTTSVLQHQHHRPNFLPAKSLYQNRFYANDFRSRFQAELRNGGVRRHKLAFTIFSVIIVGVIGTAGYYIYLYDKLVSQPLSAYPPAAAQEVKRALYYAHKDDVPNMAAHFKKAVQAAEESGMHPLSNEVAGLKMECSNMLWSMADGKYRERAVDVLEKTLDEAAAGSEFFAKENRWEERNVVLKRAVLLGYKVGEMYTEMGKQKKAEEAMVWSTETLLREGIRRHNGKIEAKDQGEWFKQIEVADFLEKLATHYESTNNFQNAAPLYLRSLTMHPAPTCHTVTLMTNLAASLAQHPSPPENTQPKRTRQDILKDAQQWAQKALDVGQKFKPPERTGECDEACVAATYNLGNIAEMLGDKKTALARYEEAMGLAKGLGMEEGVLECEKGLARAREMKDKGWFGK